MQTNRGDLWTVCYNTSGGEEISSMVHLAALYTSHPKGVPRIRAQFFSPIWERFFSFSKEPAE